MAAEYICERKIREREEEGREEERRKGSLGQQKLLFCGSALAECNAAECTLPQLNQSHTPLQLPCAGGSVSVGTG